MKYFLKKQTEPGKPLIKCPCCKKWRGSDSFQGYDEKYEKCWKCRRPKK